MILIWLGILFVPPAVACASFVLSASAANAWRTAGGFLTLLGLGSATMSWPSGDAAA